MPQSRGLAQANAMKNWEHWVEKLKAFIAYPSISGRSGNPQGIQDAATWLAETLRGIGLDDVAILSTGGNPVVYAEDLRAGLEAPTVLIYGHYDVVVAEPRDEWTSDPFQAVVKGEHLYGRGASDMKGQIITCLAAVEALHSVEKPPVNLKLLIEGEEEYPPRHLEAFLSDHRQRLQCDICLNTDAGMVAPGVPTVVYSLRGNMYCVLRVCGPRQALHTGLYGGVVHNPIHALSELVAGLHDEDGRVTIADFYENVRPIDGAERELLAGLPVDDVFYQEGAGVPALWGEQEYSAQERVGARPAINVVHFKTERHKNVIPPEASATITLRLVSDQTPQELYEKLKRHIAKNAPPTITWELTLRSGYCPVYTERDSPAIQAFARAVEMVWGKPPVFSRDGGGIPAVVWIQQVLGVASLLTGFGSPEDKLHGPDEHVHLPTLQRGVETLIHFFYELTDELLK
jgi:acetylornithine deacetylase/succinyl-diaminopimelate desuccinylase-like protein